VQELTINGFPAATAMAAGEQWSFRLYVVRFGSEIYRFIYASKNKSAETDRAFRTSIETFRRLTLAEIQGARPLRLKIITVKAGDTIESLAAHMTHVEQPVTRFRVLNGLAHTAKLKAGDRAKILIE
jgi:predicted Zn-dependent protease